MKFFLTVIVIMMCIFTIGFPSVEVFSFDSENFPLDTYKRVEDEFKSVFKNTVVLAVKESDIPGLFEIYVYRKGDIPNIIYYYPEKRLLFLGEIWDINGNSLTSERRIKFYRENRDVLDVLK